jgi:ribosome-binding factor A
MVKANDHRIGFVSITQVSVSPDLSSAKIFVSCMGTEEEKKRSMRGLRSASSFIRSTVSQKIDLRYMPKLIFIRDDSLEEGDRILDKLAKLKAEREVKEHEKDIPTA